MTSYIKHRDLCPITETIKLIGKKWNLLILRYLTEKSMRFNELKNKLNGISSKTLAESLAYLTDHKLVERKVKTSSPIRVEYKATKKAKDLKIVLEEMGKWGRKWLVKKKA